MSYPDDLPAEPGEAMPERIWAGDGWYSSDGADGLARTAFVRADLHDALRARVERLEAALRLIVDDQVPPVPHHNDRDRCIHRKTMREDCKLCTISHARAALSGQE